MKARVFNVVAVAGGGDGGNVANVLDHGGKGQGDDGDDGCEQHMGIDVAVHKQAEDRLILVDGEREPLGVRDVLHEGLADGSVADNRDNIGADDAEENRDDLDHALAPDVGGDDDDDGDHCDPPVLRAVVDGGGREVQADGDDDGAGDDRREEAHDLLGTERFKQRRENHVHKTRARNAEAGVGQHFLIGLAVDHGSDRCVAAEEREG